MLLPRDVDVCSFFSTGRKMYDVLVVLALYRAESSIFLHFHDLIVDFWGSEVVIK